MAHCVDSDVIHLVSSPWRTTFNELVATAEQSLLIASPFIKLLEAQRLVETVLERRNLDTISVTVLTDLRADSVVTGALDIEALCLLGSRFGGSTVVSVPRLHAKVYVADRSKAVITSANLTSAGLDQNLEYGVQIDGPHIVNRIADELLNYARLGSTVPTEVLTRLGTLGRELASEHQQLLKSTRAGLRRRFDARYRQASQQFIATQVGTRSANAVFSEAVLYVLSRQPLATVELHPEIQRLLPELCDDSQELVINGEHFGKRWKHQVRNAQQALKRAGLIRFDGRRWGKV